MAADDHRAWDLGDDTVAADVTGLLTVPAGMASHVTTAAVKRTTDGELSACGRLPYPCARGAATSTRTRSMVARASAPKRSQDALAGSSPSWGLSHAVRVEDAMDTCQEGAVAAEIMTPCPARDIAATSSSSRRDWACYAQGRAFKRSSS